MYIQKYGCHNFELAIDTASKYEFSLSLFSTF